MTNGSIVGSSTPVQLEDHYKANTVRQESILDFYSMLNVPSFLG